MRWAAHLWTISFLNLTWFCQWRFYSLSSSPLGIPSFNWISPTACCSSWMVRARRLHGWHSFAGSAALKFFRYIHRLFAFVKVLIILMASAPGSVPLNIHYHLFRWHKSLGYETACSYYDYKEDTLDIVLTCFIPVWFLTFLSIYLTIQLSERLT